MSAPVHAARSIPFVPAGAESRGGKWKGRPYGSGFPLAWECTEYGYFATSTAIVQWTMMNVTPVFLVACIRIA